VRWPLHGACNDRVLNGTNVTEAPLAIADPYSIVDAPPAACVRARRSMHIRTATL